ncbi:hypothetical protein V6N13_111056 [Hibiscus sabdariffa]|uniref:Uncharacterized protein n=1 Tax=Hibiscus sabdariffa TaxID=183260 RepID=A0ABR2TJE7_9ROSI
MTSQNLETALGNPRIAADVTAPLSGLANGRPPDFPIPIQVPTRLERVANPINEEDQQVTKKSRGDDDEVMDVGGGDFDGPTQGTTLVAGDDVMVCNGFGLEGGVGGVQSKPTSRDMLTGRMTVSSVGLSIPDLDVDMEDEDVQITSMDDVCKLNAPSSVDGAHADKGDLNNSDPIERFNPWMQATSMKTHKVMKEKAVQNSGVTHRGTDGIGSAKFSILAVLDHDIKAIQEPMIKSDSVADTSKTAKELEAYNNGGENDNMTLTKIVYVVVRDLSNGNSREIMQGSGSRDKGLKIAENMVLGKVAVASSEEVILARISLDPKSHVAVRVLESGKEKFQPSGYGHRTSAGVGSPRSKGIQRQLVSMGVGMKEWIKSQES